MRPYRKNDEQTSSLEDDDTDEEKTCLSIHNFGICFNEFCLIIFIVLCMVWNINDYGLESDYPQLILYSAVAIIILLNIVAILRLFYKKIGAILFCDIFKRGVSNPLNF